MEDYHSRESRKLSKAQVFQYWMCCPLASGSISIGGFIEFENVSSPERDIVFGSASGSAGGPVSGSDSGSASGPASGSAYDIEIVALWK